MKFLIIYLGFISMSFCAQPECTYKCAGSQKPVANPNNTPTSNVCGDFSIFSSSSLLSSSEISTCCNDHDICYETCNNVKDTCDQAFKDCMMNICKDDGCKIVVEAFHGAVQAAGCPSFLMKQKKACLCA